MNFDEAMRLISDLSTDDHEVAKQIMHFILGDVSDEKRDDVRLWLMLNRTKTSEYVENYLIELGDESPDQKSDPSFRHLIVQTKRLIKSSVSRDHLAGVLVALWFMLNQQKIKTEHDKTSYRQATSTVHSDAPEAYMQAMMLIKFSETGPLFSLNRGQAAKPRA